jgi:hypothetical protein
MYSHFKKAVSIANRCRPRDMVIKDAYQALWQHRLSSHVQYRILHLIRPFAAFLLYSVFQCLPLSSLECGFSCSSAS